MQVIAKSSAEENLKDAKELATLLQLIYTFPKPVIVLAQGVTLGGGIGLIAAADIAIVAKSAKFAFPEVKLGISPSVISPYVIAAIGARAARYYFFTAEEFNGNLAVQIGLAHQVVEANVLATTGESLAKQLLQLSSTTLTATKHLTHAVATQNISEKLIEYTTQHLVERRASAEGREGLTAFLEKRPPEWLK
jgi:methylglutaconyl-CoA hydratase